MPDKKTVEKWCGELNVASIMSDWKHITEGHLPSANGNPPPGNKSYFTGEYMATINQIYNTVSSRQKRVLYEAGNSSSAKVVRDFAPTVVGKDGGTGNNCTHVVVVIGLATSGKNNGKPIIFTSYPGSPTYVNGLVTIG